MIEATPTSHGNNPMRYGDFGTLAEALDYAALGPTGINIYTGKGEVAEALPYASIREQAIALARRMLGAGLKPGMRVGMIAESDGDFIRAFFACQYAGLVPAPMPLPVAFGGRGAYIEHVRRMIQSADASAMFTPAVVEEWIGEAAQGLGLKYCGTAGGMDNIAPFTGALPEQDAEGLSYLQFSSGSTRDPKGIAVTQRAFMANAHTSSLHGLRIEDNDRCVSWLPFYHDMGLVGFLLIPMVCQMTVDVLPTREFARRALLWLRLISRNRGTLSFSPSFGYELCTRRSGTAAIDDLDLSCWRGAGIGGDMVRAPVLSRFVEQFSKVGFRREAFVPSYGMAEATLALSFTPTGDGFCTDEIDSEAMEQRQRAEPAKADNTRTRTFVLCGEMLPGHDLDVRDANGASLGEREIGRIFVRGPSLMKGYYGAEEETAAVLSTDGWLDTGDLGYRIARQLVITGRAKDLMIVNGRNVWPQDLEWTAEAEIAGLRSGDVAVFSVDADTDEQIVALVQCRQRDEAARETLRSDIAGLLRTRHGTEANVVLVPPHALPVTTSGKLSRSKAKTLYLAGSFSAESAEAPASAG